ncbi:MAG TPA: hypothetical protein VM487_10180 [Phycisphaerae bacterium]|nr:hypothetical protein [Phycisphaerae bacterium]
MGFGQTGGKPLAKEDLQRADGTYARAWCVISGVAVKVYDDEPEPVYFLYMEGKEKPIRLNATNTRCLIENFGAPPDPDDIKSVGDHYRGNKIMVYVDPTVEFGGKMMGGIRIHGPKEVAIYKNPNKVDGNGQLKGAAAPKAGGFVSDSKPQEPAEEEPPMPEENAFEGADDIPF